MVPGQGALVPAGAHADPFKALADRLHQPGMDGELLKFIRGRWAAGKDGEQGMDGAKLVARADLLMVGWQRWENKKVTDRRVGLIGEHYTPHHRAELGDMDESAWPRDNNGRSIDPWQLAYFLQFHAPDDPSIKYVWTASSKGAQKEIGALSGAYSHKRQFSPNALPLVALGSDYYKHEIYGRVDVPQLDVVGWASEEVPAVQAQVSNPVTNPNSDIDDEIPF
jgi:hypothetical protein